MVTTRKRIVRTGLAAAVIGLSGLGAVAATGSEAPAPATVDDRCAEAVQTWPMGDVPLPEGCGCDEEALEEAIAAQPPVVLVDQDGGRTTMHPGNFISPAMVEACPDLPAMRERANGH